VHDACGIELLFKLWVDFRSRNEKARLLATADA
jgi:hypothetical protein